MAEQDKTIKRFSGDEVPVTIQVRQNGSLIDLDGYTFYFTVKTNETDADGSALIDTTTVISGESYQAELPLIEADTDELDGNYSCGITYLPPGGKTLTFFKGIFNVSLRVKKNI